MNAVEAEALWDRFLARVRQWYGTEPKMFLGAANKHRELFLLAAQERAPSGDPCARALCRECKGNGVCMKRMPAPTVME